MAGMTMRRGGRGDAVSLLGYGMMRLPTVDGSHANTFHGGSAAAIDQDLVNRQTDRALALGVNYFDTSPAYCRGESERVTGQALARHDRKSYFIATKFSNFNAKFWPLDKGREMYENSFRELRTDYIDYYLLHAIGNGGFDTFKKRHVDNGAIEYFLGERDRGRIRNLGFSFHGDPRAWEWMMERHDKYHWDFAQIQLNYVDWRHAKAVNKRNLDAQFLYADCAKRDIPVVVMEPLLGGRLARFNNTLATALNPLAPGASLASWAMRFAGHWPKVMTVLSGMTYTEHLEENASVYSPLKPLSAAELEALESAAVAYLADHTVPCNTCDYCMPCPFGIDIPKIFTLYNQSLTQPGFNFLKEYDRQIPYLRQANHCTGCGRCKPHCPQSIDIPKEIQMIDDVVERLRVNGSKV